MRITHPELTSGSFDLDGATFSIKEKSVRITHPELTSGSFELDRSTFSIKEKVCESLIPN